MSGILIGRERGIRDFPPLAGTEERSCVVIARGQKESLQARKRAFSGNPISGYLDLGY